ncbi:MAG: hypothetical protein QM689_10120 [Oscillospiraceae bacterium]
MKKIIIAALIVIVIFAIGFGIYKLVDNKTSDSSSVSTYSDSKSSMNDSDRNKKEQDEIEEYKKNGGGEIVTENGDEYSVDENSNGAYTFKDTN